MATALILKPLGVSDEKIYASYLETILAYKQENQEISDYMKDCLTSAQLWSFENYHMQGLNLAANFKDKIRQVYLYRF